MKDFYVIVINSGSVGVSSFTWYIGSEKYYLSGNAFVKLSLRKMLRLRKEDSRIHLVGIGLGDKSRTLHKWALDDGVCFVDNEKIHIGEDIECYLNVLDGSSDSLLTFVEKVGADNCCIIMIGEPVLMDDIDINKVYDAGIELNVMLLSFIDNMWRKVSIGDLVKLSAVNVEIYSKYGDELSLEGLHACISFGDQYTKKKIENFVYSDYCRRTVASALKDKGVLNSLSIDEEQIAIVPIEVKPKEVTFSITRNCRPVRKEVKFRYCILIDSVVDGVYYSEYTNALSHRKGSESIYRMLANMLDNGPLCVIARGDRDLNVCLKHVVEESKFGDYVIRDDSIIRRISVGENYIDEISKIVKSNVGSCYLFSTSSIRLYAGMLLSRVASIDPTCKLVISGESECNTYSVSDWLDVFKTFPIIVREIECIKFPETLNDNVFDLIKVDVNICAGNDKQFVVSVFKQRKRQIMSYVVDSIAKQKAFKKFGIPVNFLKAERATVKNDGIIQIIFGLRCREE